MVSNGFCKLPNMVGLTCTYTITVTLMQNFNVNLFNETNILKYQIETGKKFFWNYPPKKVLFVSNLLTETDSNFMV